MNFVIKGEKRSHGLHCSPRWVRPCCFNCSGCHRVVSASLYPCWGLRVGFPSPWDDSKPPVPFLLASYPLPRTLVSEWMWVAVGGVEGEFGHCGFKNAVLRNLSPSSDCSSRGRRQLEEEEGRGGREDEEEVGEQGIPATGPASWGPWTAERWAPSKREAASLSASFSARCSWGRGHRRLTGEFQPARASSCHERLCWLRWLFKPRDSAGLHCAALSSVSTLS